MRKGIIVGIALLVALLVPAVALADGCEVRVYGTEYGPSESGTIYSQILNGDGSPANGATVTLTLWASDASKELDGVSMSYIAASNGIYKYDFTSPAGTGVYVADVSSSSPTGYGSAEVHVSSTGASAADIWGEAFAGYTDTTTFGGLINDMLGGGTMPMLFLLGLLALGLIIAFFVWRSGVLAYGAAGSWLLLGFVAFQQSDGAVMPITDTYMGLFWLCVAFTIACALLPSVMREKPSADDIYPEEVDEVTGEKIVKEEGEGEKKTRRRFPFGRTGKM